MTIPFDSFAAFAEPLTWRQDKSPHLTGTFRGVVLQGTPDSTSAGHPSAGIHADPWTVEVSQDLALVARFAVGDTLERGTFAAEKLSIQQIVRTETGWRLNCTCRERSPR